MAKVNKRDKYQLAYRLYMDTDMTQAEIAEYVSVTEKTLTHWKVSNDWETLKAAYGVTTNEIIVGYLKQLKALKDQIDTREPALRYPSTAEADIIMKITKSINVLQKDLTLSNYIGAYQELLKFTMTMKPEIVKDLSSITREFVQVKVKELAKG